jgi:hypothetical protein
VDKKMWASLTDEEVWFYFENEWPTYDNYYGVFKLILEWQEEKIKEKNGGLWADKLLDELDEANKALRIAVGLLSTYPKFSSQHPEYTFEYILKMAREKNCG